MFQAEEELKNACERKSLQLQEMGRRERLLKSDVDRAKVQVGGGVGVSYYAGQRQQRDCFSHGEGRCTGERQNMSSGKEKLSTKVWHDSYLFVLLSMRGLSEGFVSSSQKIQSLIQDRNVVGSL